MYGSVPVAGLTLYMVMSIRVLSPVSVLVVGAAVVAVVAGGGNGSIPLPLPADGLEAYMWERNEGKCVGCGITFALDAPPSVVVLVRLVLRSDGASVDSRRPLEGAENTPFTWYTRKPFTLVPYSSLSSIGCPLAGRACLVC